jgi:hypothetical protein
MDYYSDYFTSLSSDLRYHVNDGLAMGLGFGYSQPIKDDEEQVSRYGFDDVSVGAIWPQLMKFPSSRLSGSLNAILPTSRASQKASLMTSIEAGLNYFIRWKWVGISTSHAAIFSHYEFDTADEQGEVQNSPYGLNNSVTGSIYLSPRFTVSGGGGIYLFQNYSGKNKQVLSARTSASFQVSQQFSLQAAYSWRDTLITNNSFLDDDTTTASLSMSYTF